MKYTPTLSRVLIALLFVVAGYQKLTSFAGTSAYINSLGVPAATLVTALVIIIEVVVALAFAYGYKIRETAWILMTFTALATVLVHHDFSVGANMVMALKNIAIIGGLLAIIHPHAQHA